jgi:hypothetical protein
MSESAELDEILGLSDEKPKSAAKSKRKGRGFVSKAAPTQFYSRTDALLKLAELSQAPGAPRTFADALAQLTAQQAMFVTEVMAGTDRVDAVIKATKGGIARVNASSRATRWLNMTPPVMLAVDLGKREMAEKAGYTASAAMQEANDAIEFAKATKNANAYVKAVELRAKMSGLLVDRVDVRSLTAFSINLSGIDDLPPIDVGQT